MKVGPSEQGVKGGGSDCPPDFSIVFDTLNLFKSGGFDYATT